MNLHLYGLDADLELALSIEIDVGSDMDQNCRVPVMEEELIAFLVRMRARYQHDEPTSAHRKVNINTLIRYLRLDLDAPDESIVREDALLDPEPVWYVPLKVFRMVSKCRRCVRRLCRQNGRHLPKWRFQSRPMPLTTLYCLLPLRLSHMLLPRFSTRMLPWLRKWLCSHPPYPSLVPVFHRVARNFPRKTLLLGS